MPINIVCPQCNKQYRAPDGMAGRRVRCKGCHNIFKVGDAADLHGTSSGSIHDLQSTGHAEHGIAALAGEGDDRPPAFRGGVMAAPSDPNAVFESAFQTFVPDRRENVPFKFPWSRQLDRAAPWLLVLLAAWVALSQAIKTGDSTPGWVVAVRVAVLLATFLLIVFPLTRIAVKRASRALRFELPPNPGWRTLASFALPFALVYAFWAISERFHFVFVAGVIMAVVLGVAAVYFLIRLAPREAPSTLSTTAGAFVLSLLIAAGVMYGMNLAALEAVRSGDADRNSVALSVSPIAAGLPWNVPPPKPKPDPVTPTYPGVAPEPEPFPPEAPPVVEARPQPAPRIPGTTGDPRTRPTAVARGTPDPTTSRVFTDPPTTQGIGTGAVAVRTPGNGTNAQTTTPPGTPPAGTDPAPPAPAPEVGADPLAATLRAARSPLVADLPDTSALGTFDRLAPTLTTSPWVLAVKGDSVKAWNVQTWTAGPGGELTPAGDDPRIAPGVVPTPDGKSVVRVVGFPQLALRVEPIDPAKGPAAQSVLIKEAFGRATVEGMIDAERVLVRWEKNGEQGLELWNIRTGSHGKRIPLPAFQVAGSNGRVSPDGKLYALVAQHTTPPERNPAPGAVVHGPRPHLFLFDLNRGGSKPYLISGVDARWATQPTGLAFSSDSRYVGVLFEQAGNGIVITWRHQDVRSQPVTTPLAPAQLPAPPQGWDDRAGVNRLTPVGDGRAWLVAGNVVVAVDTGAVIGALGLGGNGGGAAAPPTVVTQHVHGDTVLLTQGQPSQLRATAIKLEPSKLRAAAPPK